MDLFLKGMLLGFSIAAPVGPIGLLCINRALALGWRFGFISGLGAATADAIYGSIAAFGLGVISHFLVAQSTWIHLVGGIFLTYLGIRGLLSKPSARAANASASGLIWHYLSTLALTLTNPMTILSFIAVFAALGVAHTANVYVSGTFTVLGVFLGSTLWWLSLTLFVTLARRKLNLRVIQYIGRFSNLVILAFGIYGITTSGSITFIFPV